MEYGAYDSRRLKFHTFFVLITYTDFLKCITKADDIWILYSILLITRQIINSENLIKF